MLSLFGRIPIFMQSWMGNITEKEYGIWSWWGCKMNEQVKNYIENYKLGTLCKYFCLDYFNYHNATEDVLGTSYVFLNLLNLVFIDEVIDF